MNTPTLDALRQIAAMRPAHVYDDNTNRAAEMADIASRALAQPAESAEAGPSLADIIAAVPDIGDKAARERTIARMAYEAGKKGSAEAGAVPASRMAELANEQRDAAAAASGTAMGAFGGDGGIATLRGIADEIEACARAPAASSGPWSWHWLRGVIKALPTRDPVPTWARSICEHDVIAWIDEAERRQIAASPAAPAPAAKTETREQAIARLQMYYGGLLKAAINFLFAVDERHDTKEAPFKYSVPYGAVNSLRAAVEGLALAEKREGAKP